MRVIHMGLTAMLCSKYRPKHGRGWDTLLVVDGVTMKPVRFTACADPCPDHSDWFPAPGPARGWKDCPVREDLEPLMALFPTGTVWRLTRARYVNGKGSYEVQIRVPSGAVLPFGDSPAGLGH